MKNNHNKISVEDLLKNLKIEYRYPAQLWLWGKAISEWAGLISVGCVFLSILLVIISSMFTSRKAEEPFAIHETPREERITAEQILSPHLKDIAKFMEINLNSMNQRRETLKRFLEAVSFYSDKEPTQENVERKVDVFSKLFTQCNASRGLFIKELSETPNPFETAEVYESFRELIGDSNSFLESRNKVTSSQEENTQWKNLCVLCHNGLRKAQVELARLLNPK